MVRTLGAARCPLHNGGGTMSDPTDDARADARAEARADARADSADAVTDVDPDGSNADLVAALEALPRPPDPWKWPRRLGMAAALGAALLFVVVTLQNAPHSSNSAEAADDPAVVRRTPDPGSHVVRQSSVGVQLLPGYDGRLTIDGVTIPEDQLDGVVLPGDANYDPELGIRPNTRNRVFFTPGPDKAVDEYRTGEVQVTARFWRIADGESASRSISWAFFVN